VSLRTTNLTPGADFIIEDLRFLLLDAITGWLWSQGFTVDRVYPNYTFSGCGTGSAIARETHTWPAL
jgi:hypothetical protein